MKKNLLLLLSFLMLLFGSTSAQTAGEFINDFGITSGLDNTSELTIEMDIKYNGDSDGTNPIISSWANRFEAYFDNSGNLFITEIVPATWNTGYTLPLDTWVHLAFVNDGSDIYLYVNGSYINHTNSTGGPGTGNFVIASNSALSDRANISLDNLRIWNNARDADDILDDYQNCLTGLEPNLVVLHDFEEGTGTDLNNLAGIDVGMFNGTWVPGVGCTPKPITPVNCLSFDGSNDSIVVAHDAAFEIDEFTVEAWFKTTDNSGQIISIGDFVSPQSGWQVGLMYSDAKMTFRHAQSTTNNNLKVSSVNNLNDNRWHHVAVVKESGMAYRMYVDGIEVSSGGLSGWIPPDAHVNLKIGGGFNGEIDEVRLWNIARTEADIISTMDTIVDPDTVALVAYYRFDEVDPTSIVPDETAPSFDCNMYGMDPATDWVESYAMVYPTLIEPTISVCQEATLNWDPHRIGVVESYYLEIATDAAFTAKVAGYDPFKDMGTALSEVAVLPAVGKYYYRVRAFQASTGDVGAIFFMDSVETLATIPVPDVATLPDLLDECSVDPTAPTATDDCEGALTGTTTTTFPVTDQGTTVITWTYDDGNGNIVTQDQNVIITDITEPVPDLATLDDVTDECEVTSLTEPTATDNCGGTVTVTHDATLPITDQGTTVVTWTYDDGNGNTATQTQNVILEDLTPPTFDCSTGEITCDGTVGDIAPTAVMDNCGGTVDIEYVLFGATTANGFDDASGEVFNLGVTTVEYVFTDEQGNADTCNFEVIYELPDTTVIDVGVMLTAAGSGTYQWYNCDTEMEITGETSADFIPTETGNYAVIITDLCTDTSSCYYVIGTGIADNGNETIKVYPNPTNDIVNVSLEESTNCMVIVRDAIGRKISEMRFTGNMGAIDLSGNESGIYSIEIITDKSKYNTKIILQ